MRSVKKECLLFQVFFYRMKTCLLFTENQCQTPNGLSGNCIPLQQCTSLYSLISSSITTANRKLLQNSKCGHTEVPYVSLLSGYLHSMVQQKKIKCSLWCQKIIFEEFEQMAVDNGSNELIKF